MDEEMDSSCKQRPLILQDNSSRGSSMWSDSLSFCLCEAAVVIFLIQKPVL